MPSGYNLPPPKPLEIHDVNAAEKWKRFKSNYATAIEVTKKMEQVQVATLLTMIGEEAREVFASFTWETEDDQKNRYKFGVYCQLRKNIPFKQY